MKTWVENQKNNSIVLNPKFLISGQYGYKKNFVQNF